MYADLDYSQRQHKMINLNKQRIAVYLYALVVFSMIFGLSFFAKGDKITGYAIFETTSSFVGEINLLSFVLISLGVLLLVTFAFHAIRYTHEAKKEISNRRKKSIIGLIALLFVIGFVSFGFYSGGGLESISGAAVNPNDPSDTQPNGNAIPDIFNNPVSSIFKEPEPATSPNPNPAASNPSLVSAEPSNTNPTSQTAKLRIPQNLPEEIGNKVFIFSSGIDGVNGKRAIDTYTFEIGTKEDGTPQLGFLHVYADGSVRVISDSKTTDYDKNGQEVSVQRTGTESDNSVSSGYFNSIAKNEVRQAFSNLVNLALRSTADSALQQVCEEEWQSSEPYSNTPTQYNPGPPQSLSAFSGGTRSSCQNQVTTATAQAFKKSITAGFTYLTSWTVTPCKQNIIYNIFLANSFEDRVGIATGVANLGVTKSETKQFSNSKSYSLICIDVSDDSLGEDGFACFNIV